MTFDVIYADPPWSYSGQQDKWGAAAKFYDTMTDEDIYNLPVNDLLAERGVVFLWATGPKLHLAMEAIKRWGLHYRGVAFVWVKTRKDGVPLRAMGVRPSIVKPITEFVLAASKVKEGRPMPLSSEKVVQTVFAPRREHSRKPDEVRDRIEELYPGARKLEMFARTTTEGWEVHGNETDKFA